MVRRHMAGVSPWFSQGIPRRNGILPHMAKKKIVPFEITWEVSDEAQKKNVTRLQELLGTDIPVVVNKRLVVVPKRPQRRSVKSSKNKL
jgi:hypothetical protein